MQKKGLIKKIFSKEYLLATIAFSIISYNVGKLIKHTELESYKKITNSFMQTNENYKDYIGLQRGKINDQIIKMDDQRKEVGKYMDKIRIQNKEILNLERRLELQKETIRTLIDLPNYFLPPPIPKSDPNAIVYI
jgi:hypothetical protein